ncbi:MAG: hypothetical protein PUC74_07730 [Succinatimonas sp.]|nr:hypothetical protein [Succinatimonas sp.]
MRRNLLKVAALGAVVLATLSFSVNAGECSLKNLAKYGAGCLQKDAKACFYLALEKRNCGKEIDAAKDLIKSCRLNNADACIEIAKNYQDSKNVSEQDKNSILENIEQACQDGKSDACSWKDKFLDKLKK